MNTIQSIWDGLDWSYLTEIALSVIPALICITLHELSHGFVAYKLGDTTAKTPAGSRSTRSSISTSWASS